MRKSILKIIYHLAYKSHWRTGIVGTIACSFAALIANAMPLGKTAIFYCILSATLSSFFASQRGARYKFSMHSLGTILLICSTLISHVLSPYWIPSCIALIIISGVLYFYSMINNDSLMIAKFTIVVVAFSYHPFSIHFNISINELFISLMIGCTIGYMANTVYSLITRRHHHSRASYISESIIQWIKICQKETSKQPIIPTPKIESIYYNDIKPSTVEEQYTAISILFYKYQKIIECETIKESLKLFARHYFNSLLDKNMHLTSDLVRSACKIFTYEVTHNITLSNSDEVELCYIIQRLSDDLVHLSDETVNHYTFEKDSIKENLPKKLKQVLSEQSLFTRDRLSMNSQLAIRAMVAIPLALVISKIIKTQHPDWIILTTNLVLQVRFGDTIKRAMERTIGHIVGFIITLVLASLIWPYFSSPYFWIPALIFLCTYNINKNYFYFSLSIMITIIFYDYISHLGNHDLSSIILMTAKSRLLDTLIGATIALSASLFLFPSTGTEALENMHQNVIICFIKLLDMIDGYYDEAKFIHLKNEMAKVVESNKAVYLSFQHQSQYLKRKSKIFHTYINNEHKILQCLNSLIFRLRSPFHTNEIININDTYFNTCIKNLKEILSNNINSITVNSSFKILWPEKVYNDHLLMLTEINQDNERLVKDNQKNPINYRSNLEMIGLNNTLLNMIDALQIRA